jgi:hypothetical protein
VPISTPAVTTYITMGVGAFSAVVCWWCGCGWLCAR